MKLATLSLASALAACGVTNEASQSSDAALADNEALAAFDLEMTGEYEIGEFMVRAARQAAGQTHDIAYARCSEIAGSPSQHDCTYSLQDDPDDMLTAKIVQCHMAFYFDDCSQESVSAPI